MKCCLGNGLNPNLDNQKINLVSTVSILVNIYRDSKLTKFPFLT